MGSCLPMESLPFLSTSLMFEFVLVFIWSCLCFILVWRFKFLSAPNTFPQDVIVHFLFSWQDLCLFNLAWFGYVVGFSKHFQIDSKKRDPQTSKRDPEILWVTSTLERAPEISKRDPQTSKRGPEILRVASASERAPEISKRAPEIFSALKFTPAKACTYSARAGARWPANRAEDPCWLVGLLAGARAQGSLHSPGVSIISKNWVFYKCWYER